MLSQNQYRCYQKNSQRLQKAIVCLLIIFLLIFPKGGFKLSNIPITWGYLLIAIVTILLLPHLILSNKLFNNNNRLITIAAWIPFQTLSILSILFQGIGDYGFTISFIVSLIIMPWVFIIILGDYIDKIDLNFLFNIIRIGIILISIYGIFLFFYRIMAGKFIEIPFLTVNYDDIGMLETKYIGGRGELFKLISTYNSGMLYGLCVIMLLPLFEYLDKSFFRRLIVKLSLILTLSRTVWLGLFIHEMIIFFIINKWTLRNIIYLIVTISLILLSIYLAICAIGQDISFMFDLTLANRMESSVIKEMVISLMPMDEPFVGMISEMVYFSMILIFGIFGLCFFIISMVTPIILFLFKKIDFSRCIIKKCVALGIINYLIISFIDGALLLIPVMCFYSFLASLLVSSNQKINNFLSH